MAQQLKEPEVHTSLADYVEEKLRKSAPSRRSMIKMGFAGLLVGAGILSEKVNHAYASHASITDILDDEISSPFGSFQEYVELENIASGSVQAPSAGRAKIFRDSADGIIKRKNPDNSLAIMESSAFSAFLNVAQSWTAIQTFTVSTEFQEDIDLQGNDVLDVGEIAFRAVTDLIAGIQNQNLLDKTAPETISAIYTHSADIVMSGADIDMDTNTIDGADNIQTDQANGVILQLDGRRTDAGDAVRLSSLNASSVLTNRVVVQGFSDNPDVQIVNAELDMQGNQLKGLETLTGEIGMIVFYESTIDHVFDIGNDDDFFVRDFTDFVVFTINETGGHVIIRTVEEIFNTGDPPTVVNTSQFYAKDVSSSSEMFVIDEAGNISQLSSHNFSLYTPDLVDKFPITLHHENKFLGIEQSIDMSKLARLVEGLTNEKLVYERTFLRESWSNSQTEKKILFEKRGKKEKELTPKKERQLALQKEMSEMVEVEKQEALEEVEVEDRELLANSVPTGEYELNERTGEFEPIMKQDYNVIGTRTIQRLKRGYMIDRVNRKLLRLKTRAEAERDVPPIINVEVEQYQITSPPQWMRDRGVR